MGEVRIDSRAPEDEREAGWTMEFVDYQRRKRQFFEIIWQELYENFLVLPFNWRSPRQTVEYPYLTSEDARRAAMGYTVLKDPESHQVVEGITANEDVTLFGDVDSCIKTRPFGDASAHASGVCGDLIKYYLSMEGHRRSLQEWTRSKYIFGTSVMEAWFEYREGTNVYRKRAVDEFGFEHNSEDTLVTPEYDDPMMRPVEMLDFFWEDGVDRIMDMCGVAKRFRIAYYDAKRKKGWDKAAVEKAYEVGNDGDAATKQDESFRRGLDLPEDQGGSKRMRRMTGYSWYGNVGYKPRDGAIRRHIDILNGEVMLSEPWYGRVPFFENTVCPIKGRFPGLSPIEVIRFQQDFTDQMKMGIADAVARMIYASPMVNRSGMVDLDSLRRWRPDRPIMMKSPGSDVSFLKYDPNVGAVYQVYGAEKGQMRESAGATGAFQGMGLGVNRASGTEAAGTLQRSGTRPESHIQLAEREYLPPLAKYLISLGRRFIETDEDLAARCGREVGSVTLEDIQSEFHVQFVGSRLESTRADLATTYRDLFSLRSDPMVSSMIPWDLVVARYMKAKGMYEEAAAVGTQVTVGINAKLQMAMGQNNGVGANGNGTVEGQPPVGALPAQTLGAPGAG